VDLFPHRKTTPDSVGQATRYRNAIWGVPVALAVLLVVLWLFWWYFHRPVAVPQNPSVSSASQRSTTPSNTTAYTPPPSTDASSTEPTDSAPPTETASAETPATEATTPAASTKTVTVTKTVTLPAAVKTVTTTQKTTVPPPPQTSAVMSPADADGLNGWYTTRPTVALTPMDGRAAWYRWDGSKTWIKYTSERKVAEGTHVFRFYAVVNKRAEAKQFRWTYVDLSSPTAPTGLHVVNRAENSIELAWDASTDAVSGLSHYQLFVDDVLLQSPASGSAVVDGLIPGHEYKFFVKAVDVAGNASHATSALSVHTLPPGTSVTTNPSPPDGTNGWFITAPSIVLASHAPGGSVNYQWDNHVVFPPRAYTAPLAASEGVHVLRCYSTGIDGASGPNLDTTFSVDTIAPPAPSASAVVSGTTEIDLSWNAVTDAGSGLACYEVWDGASLFATTTATAYRCSGLGALAGHEFYVAAVDVAGNRALSASPSKTPAAAKGSAKRAVASSPNRLRLAFDSPSPNVTGTPLGSPPAPPSGYTPITGTAFDFVPSGPISGPQTVVITYSPAALHPGTRVVMMHYTGGAWVDVTTEWDKSGSRVSGASSTFSPFELFEYTTSTPASSWESMVALALVGVVIASVALRRREDSLEKAPSRESQT
jgi:hypothetical protein